MGADDELPRALRYAPHRAAARAVPAECALVSPVQELGCLSYQVLFGVGDEEKKMVGLVIRLHSRELHGFEYLPERERRIDQGFFLPLRIRVTYHECRPHL
ncbi:MAG: hypothetical protein H6Q51_2809 [Deltaproteobacteria bacterium]|nr:hypothetical protein [Deltaproteobacteria bacterium]